MPPDSLLVLLQGWGAPTAGNTLAFMCERRGFIESVALAMLAPLPLRAGVRAAPDEDLLGRAAGYPVGVARNWYYDESVRVGSFSHQGEIPGVYNGGVNVLPAAAQPMVLPLAQAEPDYRWQLTDTRSLGVDDFLARQRIMGLMIVKDGVIQVERYQYERKAADRFTSNSMAKSIVALAIGIALQEGRIASLDDPAHRYASGLAGCPLGETSLRNLLRMASGIQYEQRYDRGGDPEAFGNLIARQGSEAAVRWIVRRALPQGSRFEYASPHSVALALVVRGATGMNLSAYLGARLWQAVGAQRSALWRADKTGLEVALGNFNATLADYARLGVVLANDGRRPDRPGAPPVIAPGFLLEATDWRTFPLPFRPGRATPSLGYGYQFWVLPGERRRFVMIGVYGQSLFVDPGLRLVIVQTAANATAEAGGTSLARERNAFWRGIVGHYGG